MAVEKTLDVPYSITGIVAKQRIVSVSELAIDGIIVIEFSIHDADGNVILPRLSHTLTGQEFDDFNATFNTLPTQYTRVQALQAAAAIHLPGGDGTLALV